MSEAKVTESDTNVNGSQIVSTRDESQDPLLGELMIISQTSIEQEASENMVVQEQVTAEETEITITAIIEEINRSISSKNSSLCEEVQASPKQSTTRQTVNTEEKKEEIEGQSS